MPRQADRIRSGHQQAKVQLPLGCRVEFDLSGERPVLRYLEDLVASGCWTGGSRPA
jgi:hypothetical protein